MSNVEHGAIVAELSAGIEAACNALQAAIAAGDGAATAAAGVDDAVSAQADLLFAASVIAASAIGNLNTTLARAGIAYRVEVGEETITPDARVQLDSVIAETEARFSAALLAYVGGDRSDDARQKMSTLGKCLADLRAARVQRTR
jgi:hypothetical protein